MRIKLDKIVDVREFVCIGNSLDHNITVKQDGYVVNGKSLMGLFSLDLTKPVFLEVENDDCAPFEKFVI